jgi:hypothetical protein
MADWAKIDVGFLRHPQVCRLTKPEQLGYLSLILYAQEYETDGVIPRPALALCGVTVKEAEAMIRAGLIVANGDDLVIDGFTRKQATRAQMEKKRADARARRDRRPSQ